MKENPEHIKHKYHPNTQKIKILQQVVEEFNNAIRHQVGDELKLEILQQVVAEFNWHQYYSKQKGA
jgi:nitrate/nitrite-specific signal transduction histidine kinase